MTTEGTDAHDRHAEEAYLGALLVGAPRDAARVPGDFYVVAHQIIAQACDELAGAGQPVDLVTVKHSLEDSGKLESVGGVSYLSGLVDALPDVANVLHYSRIIGEILTKRKAAKLGACLQRGDAPEEVLGELQTLVSPDVKRLSRPRGRVKNESLPVTLSDICGAEYPEPKWAVPGIYPEGLALLCGKPKIGKSWQLLDLGLAVSMGGYAFGKIRVEMGEVLYLALEDSPRRIMNRAGQLLGPDDKVPDTFHVLFQAPALGAGLEEFLAEWMTAHPQARLVMIDTLARVRPKDTRRNDWYLEDTAMLAPLQRLAMDFGVMILAAGHLRKSASDDPLDLVSGSVGLTGVADTIAVLTRARGRADGELFITGRDIEEQTLALTKQGVQWVLEGDAEEWRMSQTRASIIKALEDAGEDGLHYRDLAEEVGLTAGTMRVTLTRMVSAEQIGRAGNGVYTPVTCNNCNMKQSNGDKGCYTITPVTPVTAVTDVTQVSPPTFLPIDLERWPADPRYQVSTLERGGMKRAAAIAKVRAEFEAAS